MSALTFALELHVYTARIIAFVTHVYTHVYKSGKPRAPALSLSIKVYNVCDKVGLDDRQSLPP